jgi:hypothetical protein
MVVYFLLAIVCGVGSLLFITNKFFAPTFRNCPDKTAKLFYKVGGSVSLGLLFLGFVFLGFYDLSINLSNELIVLEGFGLFIGLFGILALIFSILLYHNRMLEYQKTINDESKEEEIKKDTENLN